MRYITDTAAEGTYIVSEGDDRRVLATVRGKRSIAEELAVTPDLLHSLCTLIDLYGETEDGPEHPVVVQARAVLAKARGL